MKKVLKWTAVIIISLLVLVSGAVTVMNYRTYEAPYPEIHASTDSTIIERGKYLVAGPGHCADCHAPEGDYKLLEKGELVSMKGGRLFKTPLGTIQAPNITPDKETGIGDFTDPEIARSLRHGVGKDGRALFGFMPFQNLSDDDLTAIISYLRTLKPEKNKITIRKLNPAGYAVNAFLIRPIGPTSTPEKHTKIDTTIEYGAYLANNVANCKGCHTDRDMKTGAFIGEPFAGGFHMESIKDPKHYETVTPNLTPDKKTGRIYGWTQEQFINRFTKTGKVIDHSAMPWGPFKRMGEVELKAIYKYLQTLKPVERNNGDVLRKI
jgi:mono/diheme cytochrome c family protein